VSAAPGEVVLEVRGVTKAFGERQVLRGIDLAVREHEAVALIGSSGSGKSTLLRCIDLLEEIDDGDVFLDGEVITDPAVDPVGVRRRLGLVFQAYNLFPHLTALENVVLGERRAHGFSRAEADERGRAMLARFGLAGRENDAPTTSPEASSSGWRSPAPSPAAPEPCCSTRSPAPSTPSSWARSWRRCGA
jgi:polar amino acid transport system ATP-binding protein